MRQLLQLAILLLFTATAISCTGDFEIADEGNEVLVVNVLADPDSIVSASITRSWHHSEWPRPDVTVADAEVTLSVNGSPRGQMTFNSQRGIYESDGYRPAEGDRIQVCATSQKYGGAEGETTVPRKVRIDRWTFEPVIVTNHHGIVSDGTSTTYLTELQIRYSITFTDPADEDNYYLVSGRPSHETGGGTCSDPILSENSSPLDAVFASDKSFVVFSDRSIRGKTYTLSYTCTYTPFIPVDEFAKGRLTDRISLCSISREYYLYLLSVYKKYGDLNLNLEDTGLSEPKVIYSNVNPGAGVVAAQSADTIAHDVHDIVCGWTGYDPFRP